LMKREEKVLSILQNLIADGNNKTEGITAQELADYMKLDRGNVSKDLNALVSRGALCKTKSRPVYFTTPDDSKSIQKHQNPESDIENNIKPQIDSLNDMIGHDFSLKSQIKQAKSAMLYPPHGLHTILTGLTGTGKTTFARKMYEYAIELGTLKPHVQFVIFNCSEYAQNPQLLNAILFGYKKGAFTGADKDTPGLVESADGGVLFLDEIHHLPFEGQEMLFTLIDSGKFRRLGEAQLNRKAEVLIIGATTEDLNVALLKTFLRRIPVIIQMPSLSEKPLTERLQFIEMFISSEQKNIGVPIQISQDVLLCLLFYKCTGNIGQLKADIQLLCARAFWEYKVGNKPLVELTKEILPSFIERGFIQSLESKQPLVTFLKYQKDQYIFSTENPDTKDYSLHICWPDNTISHQYFLLKKYETKNTNGVFTENISEIDHYIRNLTYNYEEGNSHFDKETLLKFVDEKIYNVTLDAIKFAELKLGRKLSNRVKIGFMMHVNAIFERDNKTSRLKPEYLRNISLTHPEQYKVAKLIIKILEEEFSISLDSSEVGFITLFLCSEEEQSCAKIGVIVITHGENTAKSMADTANNLLGINHCQSIDIPLNVSVESAYNQTLEKVIDIDEGRGVLLLVDMGSLNTFASQIQAETNIKVMSISMVSTILVIEATRLAFTEEYSLDELVFQLYYDLNNIINENRKFLCDSPQKKQLVLVTCMSGKGAALKIGEIIQKNTKLTKSSLNIKYVDAKGLDEHGNKLSEQEKKSVVAVVGTVSLKVVEAPFISVDELVTGNGCQRLTYIFEGHMDALTLSLDNTDNLPNNTVLVMALQNVLEFLNPEKATEIILKSYHYCLNMLKISNDKEHILCFTVHVAGMVERLILQKPIPYKNIKQFRKEHIELFEVVRSGIRCLEEFYGIEVPDTEIAYLAEILLTR
jgi:transcriptional regulatory protein LevR/transcriptional regulator with AAA-type ATPase domain